MQRRSSLRGSFGASTLNDFPSRVPRSSQLFWCPQWQRRHQTSVRSHHLNTVVTTACTMPRPFPTDLYRCLQSYKRSPPGTGMYGFPTSSTVPIQKRIEVIAALEATVDEILKAKVRSSSIRPPLCVNSGASGSGKTEALRQVSEWFVGTHPNSRAVFISFNGGPPIDQSTDRLANVDRRLAHRLLFAVLDSAAAPDFADFVAKLALINVSLVGAVTVVRKLLDMPTDAHFLIAADELRKLGDSPEVGEASVESKYALQALSIPLDVSVDLRVTAPQGSLAPGATIVCASSYGAYDIERGVTIDSARPVNWMPLPPLRLNDAIKIMMNMRKRGEDDSMMISRLFLYQTNARMLTGLLSNGFRPLIPALEGKRGPRHVNEELNIDIELLHRKKLMAFIDCLFRKRNGQVTLVEKDILTFIRSLFRREIMDASTAFHANLAPAVWAEAAGLCSIIRTDSRDAVYMHPAAVNLLLTDATVEPMVTKHQLLKACLDLTESLMFLPREHECGKGFELCLKQLMKCMLLARADTKDFFINDFFRGCSEGCPDFCILPGTSDVEEVLIDALPRANPEEECTLPMLPTLPWMSSVNHEGNTAAYILVSLPLKVSADGKPRVMIMLQVKKWWHVPSERRMEKHLRSEILKDCPGQLQCNTGDVFRRIMVNIAKNHIFIHCVCSVSPATSSSDVSLFEHECVSSDYDVHEAVVDLDHIGRWCPMFGVSTSVAAVWAAESEQAAATSPSDLPPASRVLKRP